MKNFLLFLVSVFLGIPALLLGSLFTLGRAIWQGKGKKILGFLSNSCISLALAIDHFGNVVCRDMFNSLLLDHGGYPFGDIRETISSALGKNQERGTLTAMGRGLAGILDYLDPGHCKRSITQLYDA